MRGLKKQRIIRILLNSHFNKLIGKKSLSKYRISKLAHASFPWTHEFLKQLEKIGIIKRTEVINPKELFTLWSKLRKKAKYKDYMIKEPLELLSKIKLHYALTTYVGETLLQSHLFPLRADIYIKREDQEKWHKILSESGFFGKGNFRILIEEDEDIFDNSIKTDFKIKRRSVKFNIVSMPQLILDLLQEGGPCEEAADMLIGRYFKNI